MISLGLKILYDKVILRLSQRPGSYTELWIEEVVTLSSEDHRLLVVYLRR